MTDDLVKRLRESAVGWDELGFHVDAKKDRDAAARIEQLEAALREIANPDNWEGMDWISHGVPKWIARAALEKKDD
jgi:hypothetical protein